jgi:hypothetical protein
MPHLDRASTALLARAAGILEVLAAFVVGVVVAAVLL